MRAPRLMAISAARRTPTAVSPGKRPISPTSSRALPETQRRALYGRAKGKALRAHHAGLMRSLLPRLEVDLKALRAGTLFSPPRELWLEIGFGGAEHLLARAAENPEVGFIG